MNIINFEKYFYTWLEGISNEIKFWDNLFESKGKRGGNTQIFEYRMNPNCPFCLWDDLKTLIVKF